MLEPEGESGTRPRSYSDFRTDLQQLGKQYVDRESQAVLAELTQYGEMIYPKILAQILTAMNQIISIDECLEASLKA